MSKVSTRPQKPATAVTAAVTTVTPSAWEAEFNTARDSAVTLLEAAHEREATSDTQIYWHLTGVAARLLAAETVAGSPSQREPSSVLYDILALLNACLLGGEDLDDTAVSLVRQAHNVVHLLAVGEPALPPTAPASASPPVATNSSIDWLDISTATGGIGDGRILLEMLLQEAGFNYADPVDSSAAQSRIFVLANAADDLFKKAEDFFEGLVTQLQGAAS